jgi:hypothetical protein
VNEERDDPTPADPDHEPTDGDPTDHEPIDGNPTPADPDHEPTPTAPDRGPGGPGPEAVDPAGAGNPTRQDQAGTGPEPPIDIDTEFAAIVARWSTEDSGARPWPAAEDVSPAPDPTDSRRSLDRPDPTPPPGRDEVTVDPLIPPVWAVVPAEQEERFVPPDPPPMRGGDLVFRLAWAGVLGGPLFILATVVLTPEISRFWLFLAVLAFLAGFVTLVARLPRDRGEDDDDGAVI